MDYVQTIKTPVGDLKIEATAHQLTRVSILAGVNLRDKRNHITERCAARLEEYFKGHCSLSEEESAPIGTPFQQQVWKVLATIPYGQTVSYAWVASQIGRPSAVRAVANAIGKNPIAIIVPCHRVIGSNGKLTGYAGGLEAKTWLLQHEAQKRPSNLSDK